MAAICYTIIVPRENTKNKKEIKKMNEPNVVAWFVLMVVVGVFVAWVLWKLYEHDYNKAHKDEDNFNYWS